MSYQFYLIIHLLGLILIFSSLGGAAFLGMNGILRNKNNSRKLLASGHGVGWLLMFVSGFGLLARLGLSTAVPTWAYLKIVLLILLGAVLIPLQRSEEKTFIWWVASILVAFSAILLVTLKPF